MTMHRGTVRRGLNLMTAGIAMITVASFFPAQAAHILVFSTIGTPELVFFGLFAGGLISGAGVMVTVAGVLKRRGGLEVRVMPSLVILAVSVILFFALFYLSCTSPEIHQLRPGETIAI